MRPSLVCLSFIAIFLEAPGWTHGIVGKRMFIEPLFTEDANLKNELVLPLAKFGVEPDGTWRQIGISFEKQIYPGRLSLILESGRINRHVGKDRLSGWDNLDLGLKYGAYTNEQREFVLTPALFATLPVSSGEVVEQETALMPMLLYGKGFGDLPVRLLRPFAIQGDLGITASVKSPFEKRFQYDAVLMYSIPYLNHWVRNADAGYSMEHSLRRGLSRGSILGNLFPFLEFNGVRPVNSESEATAGSFLPGIVWMGKYVQAALAADIPIQWPGYENRPHTGFCFSLDWFLDEIFPGFSKIPFGKKPNHP